MELIRSALGTVPIFSQLLRLQAWFPRDGRGRDQAEYGPVTRLKADPPIARRFAPLGCLAALAFLCCGSIGEPLPPLLHIPERAEGLTARQTTAGIVLEWTPPVRTAEAMPLRDALRFVIHRLALSRPDEVVSAERFERESLEVGSLDGREPGDDAAGERLRVRLDFPQATEKSFVYAIRAEGRRGRSLGFSNFAVIEVVKGPGEPGRPSLTPSPEGILVEWAAAEHATSYRVLRGSDPAKELTEIGTADGTQFLDTWFAWDQRYVYRVRSLRRSFTGAAEGPLGPSAEVVAEDVFPPAPPRELRAVPTESSVELSWQPNTERDLAGYRVYRERGTAASTEVGSDEALTAPRYSDGAVERGETYRYAITAVDRKGNESGASPGVVVVVP